ncbi:NAD-dependent deacetylase [Trueperella pecoris]|uniref:protein acetyllysine N-acetyltransferase n=1 Tax=Trueperella pecoris TaxID=2733571 RepID=A0A7M1R475_9ACTO|nr:Sir2 family NAD-dependent protein deacetylase [Trueperella pecoris]QOR48464.1 NAD-dependent deacetylase [Trueperella pecoris]
MHQIEDYFPRSSAPHIRIKNAAVPPASDARPDPTDLAAALSPVLDVLRGRRIVTLTGAGLSTDSGLPDYRSPGSRERHPMTIQQFMAEDRWRRHYWARNHVGWRGPARVQPNAGHTALAYLERIGIVDGIITQNVDRLHSRAGSVRVVDLHGRFDEVLCTACGTLSTREALDRRLTALNPDWLPDDPAKAAIAPDADATVSNTQSFRYAACEKCGGILRTNVVFFGGVVPSEVVREASALIDDAEALLIAGSSLAVGSALRLVRRAHLRNLPIVIINRGNTRGDKFADVRVHAGTSESLTYLATNL